MQLTARVHRTTESSHNIPSYSDDIGDDDASTPRQGISWVNGSSKSLRRQWLKRSYTQAIICIRRLRYQWEHLSRKSKVVTAVLLLLLGQHVILGLWDQLFYDIGIIGQNSKQSSTTESYFAVAVNTYKRPDMLKEAVQHYADKCGRSTGISQVFIVWAEPTSQVPSPDSFFDNNLIRGQSLSNRATVHVLKKAKDSLNSRFEPIPELETTAVFMVDDDLRVSCPSLKLAFQAWKAHPDSMVGYYPRLASPPRGESTSNELIYHTWPAVFWKQSFNFVLTKASFLHAKYLELYSNDQLFPRAVKDHVDQHKNCEDIAMSMLVANYTRYQTGTRAGPIYVEGNVGDKGLIGGISTGSGHWTTRSDCLTLLTAILQKQGWEPPLQYQVSLREFSWIRHSPGFWWQYRPSNFFEWFGLANTFT